MTAGPPAGVVRGLVDQLVGEPLSGLLLFASAATDFASIAGGLQEALCCPSLGCTTAGEISPSTGHTSSDVVAVGLRASGLRLRTHLICDLHAFDAQRAIDDVGELLGPGRCEAAARRFGLLLIDGLSMAEEHVCRSLAHAMFEIPFAGGSAGDDLRFERTWVSCDGQAAHGAAVLGIVETTLPVRVFQTNHFEPTSTRLVITDADPRARVVREINGEPAAAGYARAVGIGPELLGPRVFAACPVLQQVGEHHYVRSIRRADPDGSLLFYCAVDQGSVLRLGRPGELVANLERELDATRRAIGEPGLILGFDCILRRLEQRDRGLDGPVAGLLRGLPFAGFSTYGEQFNGVHINQTLTGVAIGAAA